jgi:alkanesulfonate monooxygenase SsuD/methylene tetrahydromethanopterin reductase-like flavin-dependent oxidoreductase (luciferase family)/pimeloyl-ACP methyl ester carboxylesterase
LTRWRERTVIVPSLPGFGGDRGHTVLDSHLDWVLAVRHLLQKSGARRRRLAASSVGAYLQRRLQRLAHRRAAGADRAVGLFDEKDPMTDPWAQRPPEVPALLCADPERWNQLKSEPEGANSPEWPIEQARANEAAARAFWPLGNTRLEKRLPLIEVPTLLIWGEQDRIIPRGYADRFAAAIKGRSEITMVPDAGHLAELDKPDEVAAAILRWTNVRAAGDERRIGREMIKRFHALYVGQIALDNIGIEGTPANDRRYSNDRLIEAFWAARDVAQIMDELGYYCLWTAEHHFQREGYECLPNLIQLGLWLATQTKRLKFGCGFNILPMWHPIRLAEDYAMADIVTDGRVIMGVGRGYHTREMETLGAPLLDTDANRAIFEEGLELLLKCFNEEAFQHKGKYFECPPPVPYRGYQLEEITVVPRPKHLPVEIWMPIASGRTIDLMAQKGLKAMVTLNGEKILDDVVRAYHAACARHGRPKKLGEDMIWGAGLYLADTQEEAMRRVEHSHDARYQWFAPSALCATPMKRAGLGTPGAPARVPSLADGVKQKAWFCGPPSMSSTVSNRSRRNTRSGGF